MIIGCINNIFLIKKFLHSSPVKYPRSLETPITKHVKANTFKALLATSSAFFSQVQTNLLDATFLFPYYDGKVAIFLFKSVSLFKKKQITRGK